MDGSGIARDIEKLRSSAMRVKGSVGILAAIGAVRILLITLGRILTLYDMSYSVWNDVEAGDYVFVVIVGVISVILMAVMAFVQFMYYWTGRE